MSEPAESRLQAARDAIVGYIARHPCAADNEHGIAQWWLPDMGVDVPLSVVRQALQALLLCQLLTCTELPDGSVIYRAVSAAAPDGPR
ncbi:MAG: hypothetical protein JNL87_11405 [Burkholderiaceae bacterium]|nr:hypothetical protein [Burkholderiaceae bacterium]